MLPDIAFVTLTNDGYVEYTENCLQSLDRIDCPLQLHSFCIGQRGCDYLNGKGRSCTLIKDDDDAHRQFQRYRTGNWSNIVYHKFVIIYEQLLKHEYVCITDGDIVFERAGFVQYLVDHIGENEMLIQSEYIDAGRTDLCSGFMFIKSTENTRQFFNPVYVEHKKNTVGWGDQMYVNNHKHKIRYQLLPVELFPNGKYYYSHPTIQPFLIHFNWVVGHEKRAKMRKHGKWYAVGL